MKKILFYINAIHNGGAERVMVNLTKQFSDNGDSVVLVTSFVDEWEYAVESNVKRLSLEETETKCGKIKRNITRISKLRKIIKDEKPDLVVSFMCEPNFRALIASIGLPVKNIISVRNDPNMEYSGFFGKLVGKFILPKADGCVFQTKDAQSYFSEKMQRKSKIIFNAVDPKFFNATYNGFDSNDIVTMGRICEQKNHKLLIDAFEKLNYDYSSSKLKIYGSGNKEELREYILSKKLDNKVKIYESTKKVESILSSSKMFVLSSDYEGMPNALLEALSVGIPSVSTDCPCGGPNMIIDNGKNGFLVEVGNCNELYFAMKSLYENNDLCKKFSTNSKKSSKMFEPVMIFNEWNDFFEMILKGGK